MGRTATMRCRLVLVAFGVVVAGCGTERAASAHFMVTDSAGITVAYSQEPRWGTVVASDRAFQFGEASGPAHLLFDRIRGVTRVDTGVIAVGNRGTSTVRILDEEGQLLTEFGGRGDGPGEFEPLREVRRCRAGVVTVFDWDLRQVQFDREGRFLNSWPTVFPDERMTRPYQMACNSQGGIVGTGWGSAGFLDHPIGNYRAEAGLYYGPGPAGPFVRIGTTPVADRARLPDGEHPHPFGRTTVFGPVPQGFVMGTADAYEIAVLDPTGDTTSIVRWRGPGRALSDEHRAAYLEWRLGEVEESGRPAVRREVSQFEMPDSLPAYSAIQVDPSGVIWVGEFAAPWMPRTEWWGFLPTGEWGWVVELEPGFEVAEFGDGEVLGVVRDEYGVERVRGYRLVLPRDST